MDVGAITGAYQGLKAAKEIFGGLMHAKVIAEAEPKILEALQKLGDAQDTLFALREHLFNLQLANDQLRRQIDESNAWQTRIKQYELTKTDGGAVVYKFKDQPEHFACPGCFNSRQIHILQTNGAIGYKYRCTGCANEFFIDPQKGISNTTLHKTGVKERGWNSTDW